jgi:hypothetical protein
VLTVSPHASPGAPIPARCDAVLAEWRRRHALNARSAERQLAECTAAFGLIDQLMAEARTEPDAVAAHKAWEEVSAAWKRCPARANWRPGS